MYSSLSRMISSRLDKSRNRNPNARMMVISSSKKDSRSGVSRTDACYCGRSAVSLPAEVILGIIQAAYFDENFEPDYQLLANCALVCRTWSAPAQHTLFRHVLLRSLSSFLVFQSAVSPRTNRGRALAEKIVRLRVIIDFKLPDPLTYHALARAVGECPNLYELDVSLYGSSTCSDDRLRLAGSTLDDTGTSAARCATAPPFDTETLRLLRSGPRIRSLRFANWSDNDGLVVQLLAEDAWPTLTALSLKGTLPSSSSVTLKNVPCPFKCQLTELQISLQSSALHNSNEFVAWLLTNSKGSLRRLEIGRDLPADFFRTLLNEYGRNLESLSIPSCLSRGQVVAVLACERLKELKLENSLLSPLILKQLPTCAQHIALTLARDSPLYLVVNFVRSSKFNLKAITLFIWDENAVHPQLPVLKMACASRGIMLRCFYDIRRFRTITRGDPIFTSSFPREKAVSNLYEMRRLSQAANNSVSKRRYSQIPLHERFTCHDATDSIYQSTALADDAGLKHADGLADARDYDPKTLLSIYHDGLSLI